MATVEKEGRLRFNFAKALSAERLDQPRTPQPQGMALVDFVVEEKHKTLLIEVKDPDGAPSPHRANALSTFVSDMKADGLIHEKLVPKARDSYTFLHLMGRDDKSFVLVCLLGVGTSDPALLGNFKNRLLSRLRQEAAIPWVRRYVEDCVVVTPTTWATFFPNYPLKIA